MHTIIISICIHRYAGMVTHLCIIFVYSIEPPLSEHLYSTYFVYGNSEMLLLDRQDNSLHFIIAANAKQQTIKQLSS